jgi:hypothetical protein
VMVLSLPAAFTSTVFASSVFIGAVWHMK